MVKASATREALSHCSVEIRNVLLGMLCICENATSANAIQKTLGLALQRSW